MIKLVAIDMDGTLLNSQKEIPSENIMAIQKAAAKGCKIVLCTGRPKSGILPYFEQLGLSDEEYIIMNNGCSTYQTKDWTLLDHRSLSWEDLLHLEEVSADLEGVHLTLTAEKTYYVVGEQVPDIVAYDAGLVFDQARACSLEQIKEEGQLVFQAMYMGDELSLDRFEAQKAAKLAPAYSTVRSQSYIYEVMPQGATKASGLKQLAESLGLAPQEIMAIGDAANDLEMLDFAGHSVAMGNASPEVKARARYETTSNDEAGVAKALYDYVLR